MPRTLSLAGLIAKNNLEQGSPWLFLFDIDLGDTTLYLAKYNEQVVWGGNTYQPYFISMDSIQEKSDGSMPQIRIGVSNVMREMDTLMQQYKGLRGKEVTIHVVHKDDPSAGELVQSFMITEGSANATMANFTLEKNVPALELVLPGRSFNLDEFPGIDDTPVY